MQNQELTISGSEERAAAYRWTPSSTQQQRAGRPAQRAAGARPEPSARNNPFFVGGYGTCSASCSRATFPNYALGFNLNIPLRNRAAQAEMINDELTCASSSSACSGWKTRCAWTCRTR